MSIIGVIVEGDSISQSYDSTSFFSYGFQALATAGAIVPPASDGIYEPSVWVQSPDPPFIFTNVALPGSRVNTNGPIGRYPGDLVIRAPLWVDSFMQPNPTPVVTAPVGHAGGALAPRKYILSVLIGTNPDSASGVTHAEIVGDYLIARKSAGFAAIILGTLLPNAPLILPDFEGYRTTYNAIIRDPVWQGSHGVDGIFDFGADPVMGDVASIEDTDLYPDGTHPSAAGHAILAPIWWDAVTAVIAGL